VNAVGKVNGFLVFSVVISFSPYLADDYFMWSCVSE
jgi:hypothetical protein